MEAQLSVEVGHPNLYRPNWNEWVGMLWNLFVDARLELHNIQFPPEQTKEGKRFVNCKYQIPECRCCHSTDYGACQDYLSQDEKSEDGMCVYCDHHKKCHVLADEKSYNTPL